MAEAPGSGSVKDGYPVPPPPPKSAKCGTRGGEEYNEWKFNFWVELCFKLGIRNWNFSQFSLSQTKFELWVALSAPPCLTKVDLKMD